MDFKFSINQKGNKTLLLGVNRYNLNVTNKNGSQLWRCVNRTECSASITLDKELNILRRSSHTCEQSLLKQEVYLAMNSIKQEVCEDLAPVGSIYEKHVNILLQKQSDEDKENLIDYLPPLKKVQDALYKKRKRYLNCPKLTFTNLEEVKVPNALGKNFLVCEDGMKDKILIFASRTARRLIKGRKGFYLIDGTFQTCPQPFYQLVSLHMDLGSTDESNNVVAVVFALLPDKREHTYVRFFSLIKEHLKIRIQFLKSDYEIAIMNAATQVFPEAEVFGCLYHYQRAIFKKAKELDLDRTPKDRKVIRMISNLPLLPASHIRDGWLSILEICEDSEEMKKFKKYFDRQWLGKFSSNTLSCSCTKHRTTNLLEGWHRRLAARIPKKPNVFLFLQKLIKEAARNDYKIKNHLFFSTRKNRRNSDILYDKKYKCYLKELEDGTLTSFQFLRKMIFCRLNLLTISD